MGSPLCEKWNLGSVVFINSRGPRPTIRVNWHEKDDGLHELHLVMHELRKANLEDLGNAWNYASKKILFFWHSDNSCHKPSADFRPAKAVRATGSRSAS